MGGNDENHENREKIRFFFREKKIRQEKIENFKIRSVQSKRHAQGLKPPNMSPQLPVGAEKQFGENLRSQNFGGPGISGDLLMKPIVNDPKSRKSWIFRKSSDPNFRQIVSRPPVGVGTSYLEVTGPGCVLSIC